MDLCDYVVLIAIRTVKQEWLLQVLAGLGVQGSSRFKLHV